MVVASAETPAHIVLLALVAGLVLAIDLESVHVEGKRPLPLTEHAPVRLPQVFNVGASNNWSFGVDSASWAAKTGPFVIRDTLTFVYPPFHNVVLFKDKRHYASCNFTEATLLADENQGGSPGFKFTFSQSKRTYFFGCSKGDAFSHCKAGLMKFAAHARLKPTLWKG